MTSLKRMGFCTIIFPNNKRGMCRIGLKQIMTSFMIHLIKLSMFYPGHIHSLESCPMLFSNQSCKNETEGQSAKILELLNLSNIVFFYRRLCSSDRPWVDKNFWKFWQHDHRLWDILSPTWRRDPSCPNWLIFSPDWADTMKLGS